MTVQKKTCFIITPIGKKDSETYRKTEGLLESVLEPVLEKNNYEVQVAHRISESGSINNQIITRLESSDLVIANLTELNPNVFYELGLRHAIGKHVISIAENGTNLPFDVNDQRTIFFENDIAGTSELQSNLQIAVNSITSSEEVDNPFYDAMRVSQIKEKIDSSKSEVEGESINEIIMEEIGSLRKQITNIQLNNSNSIYKNESLYEFRFRLNFETESQVKEFIKSIEFLELDDTINRLIDVKTRLDYRANNKRVDYIIRSNNTKYTNEAGEIFKEALDKMEIEYHFMERVIK